MCWKPLKELLRYANRSFADPCLKHFAFLVQDYGCNVSGCVISYETIIRYRKDVIHIEVNFAIPEIPSLSIMEVINGKIKRSRRHVLRRTGPAKQLVRAFEEHREKTPSIRWCRQLDSGEFEETFDALLTELARGFRPLASRVLQGDFSKVPLH